MVAISTGKDSKQDYQTPAHFIKAVESRFGKISFDLAASAHNKQHWQYFAAPDSNDTGAVALDSLKQDWAALSASRMVLPNTVLWLNPPFKFISPWVKKCFATAPQLLWNVRIAFLVPASVGSDWFRDYVYGKARVLFLNGRIPFDPENPEWLFPKDCMLCLFGAEQDSGVGIWKWRDELTNCYCDDCNGEEPH